MCRLMQEDMLGLAHTRVCKTLATLWIHCFGFSWRLPSLAQASSDELHLLIFYGAFHCRTRQADLSAFADSCPVLSSALRIQAGIACNFTVCTSNFLEYIIRLALEYCIDWYARGTGALDIKVNHGTQTDRPTLQKSLLRVMCSLVAP